VKKSSPVIPGGWHPWKREERKFGGLFSVQRALDIAILEINIEVESRRTIKTSASDLGDFSVQEQDVPDGD
jgi:hypothetical protein